MCRYIFIFLGLIAFTASGQEMIPVNGKIINKATYEPVPSVHIINQNNGTGTASSVDGIFSIEVAAGDTLIFSAIGYSSHSLVITKDLQEVNLVIKLDEKAMELNTVNVFAYKDLASLKRAIVNMDVPIKEDEKIALNIPPATYAPEGSGLILTGGITALINGFGLNKAYNQQQKLKKLKVEANRHRIIREKYNEKVVQQLTGMEEEDARSFIKFCRLPENFVLESTEYEISVAVHRCLDEYKELNQGLPKVSQ